MLVSAVYACSIGPCIRLQSEESIALQRQKAIIYHYMQTSGHSADTITHVKDKGLLCK